jgi:predicted RNA-binding protein YlxR (DUF448 family)
LEGAKTKRLAIRSCVVCRSATAKGDLLRIVRTADGVVKIDPTGKASGRGAYICRSADCIAGAIKRKRLDRALRTAVPAGIYEELNALASEQARGS